MKRSLLLAGTGLAAVCAIVAGAWLGSALLDNPGYVLIETGGWRLQMLFLALAEGDWARADRSLARAMRGPEAGTAGYLAAARAAQGRSSPAPTLPVLSVAARARAANELADTAKV